MSSEETKRGRRTLRPLRVLWPFVRRYRAHAVLALLVLLVAAGATLTLPWAAGLVIDHGFSQADADLIDRYFLGLFAVALVLALAAAGRFALVSWLGEKVTADLREAVYHHVLHLDPEFFESTRSGEVMSRLSTDTELIQTVIGSSASVALRSVLTLSGSAAMLILTSPKLAGLIALALPLTVIPVLLFGRRLRRLARESQDRIADFAALATEALSAIRTVKAFAREPHESARFVKATRRTLATAKQRILVRALLTVTIMLLLFGGITIVLWLGAQAVLEGRLSGGELGQFVLYAVMAAGSAAALTEVWGEVLRAAGACERLGELLDTRALIADPTAPLALKQPVRGALRFRGLGFRYPARPEQAALEDFDLEIMPGETVALVGPSGAGKSTVFQLLLRFYQPQQGRIELDGIDITALPLPVLRNTIGLVPQDPVIFGTTVRENIQYGRLDASDAALRQAADDAQASEFIERLPEQYETYLGERGVRLSGGQQQRLVIARAMLKDAPVLLLDEATSSLDAESESRIQIALERLLDRRTTLVIAHRLATVVRADRIVVLDQGRIQAIGTHHDLLRESPLYRRLAELQFGLPTIHADADRLRDPASLDSAPN